jgi:hypothetical protein
MRGTGLGYALYSEIIKQEGMYLELIGMSLIGIPQRSNFMKIRKKVLRNWYLAQMDEEGIVFCR